MIRAYTPQDWPALWAILEPVFRAGETYAVDPAISEAEARDYWTAPPKATFVAVDDATGAVQGSYFLTANHPGPGRHVANCGYVVAPAARGQGVGAALCRHSLHIAAASGYRSMQFNLVVSTNEPAVRLWQREGFQVVGTLPEAFEHPRQGLVDAFVMSRRLGR